MDSTSLTRNRQDIEKVITENSEKFYMKFDADFRSAEFLIGRSEGVTKMIAIKQGGAGLIWNSWQNLIDSSGK